jgi:hypothetical protein
MNEAVLERLTRSVRRWRLATLVLGVLLLCTLATGGTLVAMLMFQLSGQRHMDLILFAEQQARRQAEQAQQHAEAARLDAEEAMRRLQRELEAARKNGENGP